MDYDTKFGNTGSDIFLNINGNDYVRFYMLEQKDCGYSISKVVIGAIFIADIVGLPTGIIYLHCKHTRHKYVFLKEKGITNETARKRFIGILNMEQNITIRQIIFIGKIVHNYEDKLPTNFPTVWCNHKI